MFEQHILDNAPDREYVQDVVQRRTIGGQNAGE